MFTFIKATQETSIMRVSGKKAAIVLASKPETWVAKSVNSLPMAAFYMPLSGVEKATK